MSQNGDGLRPRFWERFPLEELSEPEWEALCDRCGKCCAIKFVDDDTGKVQYTNVVCRLLDTKTCQCSNYESRKKIVPSCITLTLAKLREVNHWLPTTCAYRLRHEGKPLHDWHPLISGRPESVHEAGVSFAGRAVHEYEVRDKDLDSHIVEEID